MRPNPGWLLFCVAVQLGSELGKLLQYGKIKASAVWQLLASIADVTLTNWYKNRTITSAKALYTPDRTHEK
ncbi:MAG: hypothetical protein ABJA69_07450 [Acidobacteriaceae bacterium]